MEHKLYVIEGLDGSGKATQATLLTDYLTGKGIPCRKLSFPDYNDPSSTLVKMYLHGEMGTLEEVNPYGASLFFTVDRYASYCRHWRPDYEAGKILVADRYSTSNIPHQMSRLPKEEWDSFLDWLCDVEYNKAGLPRPRRWCTWMWTRRFPAGCSPSVTTAMKASGISTRRILPICSIVVRRPCMGPKSRAGKS